MRQQSLLAARRVHADLLRDDSFYVRLADHGHEIIDDADFAHLYHPRLGRPSTPPTVMVRALLCGVFEGTLSDREMARRTRVDMDWKAAMGVDVDFPGIGATTFSLFRARLCVADDDESLLEATIDRAVEAGLLSGRRTALVDSSAVSGAGAVADTYTLIRKFIAKIVAAADGRLDADVVAAAGPYLDGKPDAVDFQDAAERRRHLAELVAVAHVVCDAAIRLGHRRVDELVELLATVIDDDVTHDDDGPKIRQGTAKDRICSHSDPQMRHGHKTSTGKFDGYKLHAVSDSDNELVLGVDVGPGNGSDAARARPLADQVTGRLPEGIGQLVGDAAYSVGGLRQGLAEDLDVEVVAKVPPTPNRGGRYSKDDFDIDLDAGTVTCPAGVTAEIAPDGQGGIARFGGACTDCPLREECTTAKAGRTVSINAHEALLAEARRANTDDPDTVQLLADRSRVERKIAHLQRLGMRTARYLGARKTCMQARLAATVANLKRLAVLGVWPAQTGTAIGAA